MTLAGKGVVAGLALALSLAAASGVADARTPGHHKHRVHPANHGAAVSAVAKSDATTGEAHGDAVSAVARSDAGKSSTNASSNAQNTQGSTISTLAQTTTATGEAKGDAISAAAQMHGAATSKAARAK